MRGNIIASIAVFQSLYNTDQDIYSVLARFVTAAINRQNLWSFNITTLRNLLKEDFGIEAYDSVLKTVIKQRLKDSIKKSDNGEYQATPSREQAEAFNRQLSEQEEKYRSVFEGLITYYRDTTSQAISDQDIIDSFTKFLLTDFTQDSEHVFSRFIFSKENDKKFLTCLNEVKEGSIIMAGLKDISDSTDLNTIGSWTDHLTIYLDTEELFSAYGYNGDLYRQILNDFFSLVEEANKRTRYIELKYLDETKNVVDGYFGQAERILDGRSRPDGKTAMNTILSRCRTKGEVVAEKGKFYAFLHSAGIEYDERLSYVGDMEGNLQTNENMEAIKTCSTTESLTMSDDDISKYLRIFSIINHKRHSERKTSFEKCRCVLLSESSIPRYMAWHPAIHDESSGFTYSTTMDYAVSRLWFRLPKGVMGDYIPASMNIMTKVKVIMASLLNQSIREKYDEVKSKKYTAEERILIYNEIRAHEVYPEEITHDNVQELIDFAKISDIETLRREKALEREKARQGEIATSRLREITQKSRNKAKKKIAQRLRICSGLFYTVWILISIGVGVGTYFAVSRMRTPQDSCLSVMSFILGAVLPNLLTCIPYIRKTFRVKQCILRRRRKALVQKYLQNLFN